MSERLRAIHDRLLRAEEHLDQVKVHLASYVRATPDGVRGELNLFNQPMFRPITEPLQAPPSRVGTLIGECIHNLRSALDHLAWQLVELNAGAPGKDTRFPILSVPPTPGKEGNSRPPHIAGGVSDIAIALVEGLQPYQLGANYSAHPLCRLNNLSNRDKHREIALAGTYLQDTTIEATNLVAAKGTWHVVEPLDDSAELSFVPDDPDVGMEGRSTFRVILDEGQSGVLPGGPVVKTLADLTKFVREDVIAIFEQRCF